MTILTRNPSNTNPLQPTKFLLSFPRIAQTAYECQVTNIPGMSSTPPAKQTTPFIDLPRAGDKLIFNYFFMEFIVDEELWSWKMIHDWMRGYTFPASFEEYKNLNRESILSYYTNTPQYSDATLTTLSSLNNLKIKINFINIFPIELSDIVFDTKSDVNHIITAKATFAYHDYCIC